MNPIPTFAQSSVNPQEVSLTIASFGKVVAGGLATYAMLKGIDPLILVTNANTVTQEAQNVVAQYVIVAPALYTAYHSAQLIWGAMRKIAVAMFAKKVVPTA